ncbi:glycosyltransferase family 2 protein [Vibrio breoganii]
MINKSVSIIIPTCNRIDFLRRAVLSVLSQEGVTIEVIIIDDSNVSLVNAISQEYRHYDNVYVYRNEKHGAATSRNLGVKYASGDLITFLDDDDFYLPGRLERMVNEFYKRNALFISSGRLLQINNLSTFVILKKQHFGYLSLNSFIYLNDIDIGIMMKKESFLKVGGFDENLLAFEDWDFILRCLLTGKGYKIRRFDYVVDDSDRNDRVSNKQEKYRAYLANKHRASFGENWYATMIALSEVNLRRTNILKVLCRSVKLKKFILIKAYFRLIKSSFR